MRRAIRFQRPFDLLQLRGSAVRPTAVRPTHQLCSACRRQRPQQFSTTTGLRRNESLPVTERLRRRIWGTDNPPGQKDVYSQEEAEARRQGRDIEESNTRPINDFPPDPTYVPATTWEGLEEIGGTESEEEQWAMDNMFEGFAPAYRVSNQYEITAALHRAIVEVFILRDAGHPFDQMDGPEMMDLTSTVQFSSDESGSIVMEFSADTSRDEILASLTTTEDGAAEILDPTNEEDVFEDDILGGRADERQESVSTRSQPTADEEDATVTEPEFDALAEEQKALDAIEFQQRVASWDPAWLQISLEDAAVKFAVVKRVMQLTGIRVSDHALGPIGSVEKLLPQLIAPPKPKKLVEELVQKDDLMSLPNVSVYERRVTPIDKEKMVGRWKLIERELVERGLPVTGHDK